MPGAAGDDAAVHADAVDRVARVDVQDEGAGGQGPAADVAREAAGVERVVRGGGLQVGDAPPALVVRQEVLLHGQRRAVDDGDGAVHGAGGDRPVPQEGHPVDGRAVVEEHV